MNILNILDNMRMLNTLNILEVRYSRYSRSKILIARGLNILEYWLTAYPIVGLVSFPYGRILPNNAKLARFLHEKGVKMFTIVNKNSLIIVITGCDKNTYQDHLFDNPQNSHDIDNFQMINDLQRHFENADNFLLVQGCKPKVALLARLAVHQFDHLNLTAGILRGHRVKGRDRQWE